jgi:hypothetical protein
LTTKTLQSRSIFELNASLAEPSSSVRQPAEPAHLGTAAWLVESERQSNKAA